MEKLLNFVIFISVCIIAYAIFFPAKTTTVSLSSGSSAFEALAEPLQYNYDGNEVIAVTEKDLDLKIYPKANYRIYAMVMGKHGYMLGWQSKVSPYDLVLAWDKLMLPEYQKGISYSQSGRWYYYRYEAGYPLPKSYISSHSANTHIIPANHNLKKAIDRVNSGDKVYLEGYLVQIKGKLNRHDVWWNSSLSRDDTGDGACEVFYLKRVVLGDEVFE